MFSHLAVVALDAEDPARLAQFWSALLGRDVVADDRGPLLPGTDGEVSVRFVPGAAAPPEPNRMHPHLTSTTPADQERQVALALELGGRHLDVGQLPEEGHIVLADPEGNAFCVIEAGNSYLAGCGLLGELACDGTREVGLFWAEALGWPLVWDQDEETAIQAPVGGTKIAWGGPPVAAKTGPNRFRFELVPLDGDQQAAVAAATAAGARQLGVGVDGSVDLADPDGNEFRVLPR